ncbi:cytochrome C assembly family protein [Cellvibrio sp. NN19]|uniref:cytochrome C assembly family protein n=1 Tax=Cellvibrio chitinivorans TaxID=3102792 RepID=UPI002B40E8B5|nr:cytochrome c biogenesis protein CcsA [Cellvibrio sp. NN19]
MIILSANLIAIFIYTAAAIYFGNKFARQQSFKSSHLLGVAALGLIAHGVGVYGLSVSENGLNFSLFTASSLIFWVINAIVLISSLKKELHNLFLLLFPLSAISVLTSIAATNPEWQHTLSYSIAAHVILSILAYSLLTIASLQALILAYQNYALKHRNRIANARLLPPLQTMESLLFELLWVGEILLTLAIISGFYFLEDMFAQHLVHKTVFALSAWFIYALLLWGRHQMGWRGNKAIRWALAGFICLMLAYFGSKLVLEIVLNRV